jgi:hypothetical protein
MAEKDGSAPTKKSRRRGSLVAAAKAFSGFRWREPRLVKDWADLEKRTGANFSGQELFFNVCFAVLMGKLRGQLQTNQDVQAYAARWCAVWTLIASGADYATRFNDDDAFHRLFWSGYGFGLMGLMVHTEGEADESRFAACMAGTLLWTVLANIRVALSLPRCRVMTTYFASWLLVNGGFWAVIAQQPASSWAKRLLTLQAFAHPAMTMSFALLVPAAHDLPMSIEYHIAKYGMMQNMFMGQMVIALTTQKPTFAHPYATGALGFVLMLAIKFLLFDTGHVAIESHAIRRSRPAALTWLLLCQPIQTFLINTTAAGMGVLLENGTSAFGRRLLCYSVAGMYLNLLVTRRQHRPSSSMEVRAVLQQQDGVLLLACCAAVCVGVMCSGVNKGECGGQSPLWIFLALAAVAAVAVASEMRDKHLVLRHAASDPPLSKKGD